MRIVEIKLRYYARKLHAHKSINTKFRSKLLNLIHSAEQYHGQEFSNCPADSSKVLAVQEYAQSHQPEEVEYNHRDRTELPADELISLNENVSYLLDKGYLDDEIQNILEITPEVLNRCYLTNSKVKQSRDKAKRDHNSSAMWLVQIKNNMYSR